MYSYIHKAYNRPKQLAIILVISFLITFAAAILTKFSYETTDEIIAYIFALVILFLFLFIVLTLFIVIGSNLTHSITEEKIIPKGIEFLAEKQYSSETINTIIKRAEVGHNSGAIRTLLPAVIISILISILPNIFNSFITQEPPIISGLTIFIIIGGVFTVAFAFLSELEKSNKDSSILACCIEYQLIQQQNTKHQNVIENHIPIPIVSQPKTAFSTNKPVQQNQKQPRRKRKK